MSLRRYYTEPKKPTKPKRFAELRDEPFLAWIRQQPCCVSGVRAGELIEVPFPNGKTGKVRAIIEVAHVKTRATGGPDKHNVIPLELSKHREQHRLGIKSFMRKYNVDLRELAQKYGERYDAIRGE